MQKMELRQFVPVSLEIKRIEKRIALLKQLEEALEETAQLVKLYKLEVLDVK